MDECYRIYFNSPAGMSYTGTWTTSEEKAKEMCKKFDEGRDTTYGSHEYRKV